METYNDERRMKVSVASCEPIDYVVSGRRLLASIKKYAAAHWIDSSDWSSNFFYILTKK